MTVAETLRESRATAGLRQRDVAAALEISVTFLNDLEHGRRRLGLHHVPHLPPAMRGKVAEALIAEHEAAIAALRFHVEQYAA